MGPIGETFARRLRRLRLEHNWTHRSMAELLHRDVTTVYQWEAGTSHPRFDDIGTVADLLEVTSDYLIRGRESDQWRR